MNNMESKAEDASYQAATCETPGTVASCMPQAAKQCAPGDLSQIEIGVPNTAEGTVHPNKRISTFGGVEIHEFDETTKGSVAGEAPVSFVGSTSAASASTSGYAKNDAANDDGAVHPDFMTPIKGRKARDSVWDEHSKTQTEETRRIAPGRKSFRIRLQKDEPHEVYGLESIIRATGDGMSLIITNTPRSGKISDWNQDKRTHVSRRLQKFQTITHVNDIAGNPHKMTAEIFSAQSLHLVVDHVPMTRYNPADEDPMKNAADTANRQETLRAYILAHQKSQDSGILPDMQEIHGATFGAANRNVCVGCMPSFLSPPPNNAPPKSAKESTPSGQ